MMMKTRILIAFGFISLLFGCYKQEDDRSINNQLSSYLDGDYSLYRVEADGVSTYYFDTPVFLSFLSAYGLESPNVFDYNGSGAVDAADLTQTLSGFGATYSPNYDLYSADIYLQASSGWGINLQGWNVCFLKTTPWDESPPGNFIPDTLKSFFLDGVLEDGTFTKVWYYKN